MVGLGSVIEGFCIDFLYLFVNECIAAFDNGVKMSDLLIIIVFLIGVHILNFIECFLADIFVKDISLFFLLTRLHCSIDLSE